MYTDEYEQRGFPIKKVIIKTLIIIAIIFLLILLFQKLIIPATTKMQKAKKEKIAKEVVEKNLNIIKHATLKYYTEENIPQEAEKLTVKQMINKNILEKPIGDSKKYLNTKESYIEITKEKEQYILTIKVKALNKEDSKTIYLANYEYCTTFLCEKDETKESLEDEDVDVPSTGIYDDVVEVPNTGIYDDEWF